ncbi:MAG TPA: hypothetical protein VNI01_15665 [Elusimicrobiota bacterium]|nr:hypothetical protein [Elusimicrobiota bacterium]
MRRLAAACALLLLQQASGFAWSPPWPEADAKEDWKACVHAKGAVFERELTQPQRESLKHCEDELNAQVDLACPDQSTPARERCLADNDFKRPGIELMADCLKERNFPVVYEFSSRRQDFQECEKIRNRPFSVESPSSRNAVVEDSGSTNAAGYGMVIMPSGIVRFGPNGKGGRVIARSLASGSGSQKVSPALIQRFYADLDSLMPISGLARGRCAKSASFGSTTTITYRGQISPDLQCVENDARKLLEDVREIQRELSRGL